MMTESASRYIRSEMFFCVTKKVTQVKNPGNGARNRWHYISKIILFDFFTLVLE